MEENINYIFNDVVENIQCKFDGKLWYFDNNEAKENMIIPVKSVSNVQLTKVRSWTWLILLILAIAALVAGIYYSSVGEESDWLFFGIAIVFGILTVISFIFSVEYSLSIIPHSGVGQKMVTRKKNALNNLYETLVNSMRGNL